MKTLSNIFKLDKEKFKIPKSVQDIIPIKALWEDGIFLVGNNKYSKSFKFLDINYAVASKEDKEAMFLDYLPIRLPCYDFTPITGPTFGRALLAVRLRTSGVPDSHGVTGGVYTMRIPLLPPRTRLMQRVLRP